MKTERITVNKTPETPAGVEIDIVVPEGTMEERLLGFMLTLYLRDLKREGRISYDLPDRFTVDYRGQGRFVASVTGGDGAYYEPPRAVCLAGLRVVDNRFDLIHAALGAPPAQPAAQPAAPPQPVAETPPETPAPEPPPAAEGENQP